MIIRIFLYIIIFDLSYGQSITGNDLLSDLQNSNKNFVYSYYPFEDEGQLDHTFDIECERK